MKLAAYPVLRLLIPYLSGIILAYFCNISHDYDLFLFLVIPVLLLIAILLRIRVSLLAQQISTYCLYAVMFILGIFITIDHFQPHQNSAQREYLKNGQFFRVCVIEQPVKKEKSVKIIARFMTEKPLLPIREHAILYVSRDQKSESIANGDELMIHSVLQPIPAPKNPDEFDQQKFMCRKGIYYSSFVRQNEWVLLAHHHTHPIREGATRMQRKFSNIFQKNGLAGDEYSIITAILLGDDDTMAPSLKASYSAVGLSHILCVSGMHVGVIFMILNFLLKPMQRARSLQFVKAIILLAAIWFYAQLTGLSPSVKRAATMFTFVTVGELLRRPVNIFHSLFASSFLLLIINPLLLFEIGFEMSYLAVFGIVLIQPRITQLYAPKTRVGRYFWELAAVSVAAQMSTAPLSVYYFGQFPNYFLLSNLSVITLSFVIIITGVALLSISWISVISKFVGALLTHEIRLLNGIVKWVESLPGAVSTQIPIHGEQVLLLYAMLVILLFWWIQKKKIFRYLFLTILLLFMISIDYYRYQSFNNQSIDIYSLDKMSAISFHSGVQSIVLLDSLARHSSYGYDYHLRKHERMSHSHSVSVPIDTVAYHSPFLRKEGAFVFSQGHSFFILTGGEWLYPTANPPEVEYLYLRKSPRIPLSKLQQVVHFQKVVIDGSNSKYWASRWQDSCRNHQIPCYHLQEEGYLRISPKK